MSDGTAHGAGDRGGRADSTERLVSAEVVGVAKTAKGKWRDTVEKRMPDGRIVVIEDTGWQSNLIVVSFTRLIAGLLANQAGFLGGILFHAVGEGDPSWDISLPRPTFEDAVLFREYFRKPPTSITYRLPNGDPSVDVTNIVLIRTTLDFNEANGQDDLGRFIREQGLFGGTATGAADSGLMLNHIIHRARFKDSTLRLTRSIELRL